MNEEQKANLWSEIQASNEIVIQAYKDFLDAADNLAETMGYNTDAVLSGILPKKINERRDFARIDKWVDAQKNTVLMFIERNEQRIKKQELLKKLQLTPEQKKLLGIE